ncbi:MAG: phage tail protein [Allorhizobium sp.]
MISEVRATVPPFLRLNASTGWPLGDARSRPGIVSLDGPLKLAIAGASAIALNEPFGSFAGKRLPRGVAISSSGRLFIADPVARVIWTVQASSHGGPALFSPLWPARPLPPSPTPQDVEPPPAIPPDPYTLVSPTDLVFLANGDLAIADPGAQRVVVIAYPTAQLRQVISFAAGAPTALSTDRHGNIYIADPIKKTIHRYDPQWRRDAGFPSESVQLAGPAFLASPTVGDDCDCGCGCGGSCGEGHDEAVAVVYAIDDGRLIGLDARGYLVAKPNLAQLSFIPPSLKRGEDGALLYEDPAQLGHDPIRLTGLALTGDGRRLQEGVPLIAMPKRVQVPRSGSFITKALDGGRAGFSWDRIALSCTLPANTRLLVQTLTSDSAVEFDRVLAVPDEDWSAPLTLEMALGPKASLVPEVMVQSAAGRYLWLRISFFGDGNVSPAVSEIEIYGPRRSPMRYLPASFHQDPESVSFLDRFLSYFDTIFAEISASNRDIATLFDPKSAPEGAFLDWLGSWFDLSFLAEWDVETRREMIAEAIRYYSIRGTVAGLKKILQWHTGLSDPLPQIIEHYRIPSGAAPMIAGSPLDVVPAAHSATIVLPLVIVPDEAAEKRLLRLIAKNAPAHVRFSLRLVDPGITIGTQSTIGVDMLIGSLAPQGLGLGHLGLDFSTEGPRPRGIAPALSGVHERKLSC